MGKSHPNVDDYVISRVRALESLLLEKGLLAPDAVDRVIRRYESSTGPMLGARAVARAWRDPAYRSRLLNDPTAGQSGRHLLERASRASLTLARMRQYQTFLGNPDPSGSNETTYTYRTAARPAPPPAAIVHVTQRDWTTTIAISVGLLLAAAGGLFVWSRS